MARFKADPGVEVPRAFLDRGFVDCSWEQDEFLRLERLDGLEIRIGGPKKKTFLVMSWGRIREPGSEIFEYEEPDPILETSEFSKVVELLDLVDPWCSFVPRQFEVVVGNVGTVFEGTEEALARKIFKAYVEASKNGEGRAAGERISLIRNEQELQFYMGAVDEYDLKGD